MLYRHDVIRWRRNVWNFRDNKYQMEFFSFIIRSFYLLAILATSKHGEMNEEKLFLLILIAFCFCDLSSFFPSIHFITLLLGMRAKGCEKEEKYKNRIKALIFNGRTYTHPNQIVWNFYSEFFCLLFISHYA